MKELSLHLLDIAENSVAAGATELELSIAEEAGRLTMTVSDNGKGMSPELLAQVQDPFTTTRTTRKVGLGLPLLRLSAEQTGGSLSVTGKPGEGTVTTALFHTDHIDCPPLGDVAGALSVFLQGSPPTMETRFVHRVGEDSFLLDTRELRAVLGDIPLSEPQVVLWIMEHIKEQEALLSSKQRSAFP